jgi:DNA-binding XRE family transcriptional regulator
LFRQSHSYLYNLPFVIPAQAAANGFSLFYTSQSGALQRAPMEGSGRARLAAKMTQAEVADKMGTSQSQIARMESGHHLPNFSSIKKYAKAVSRTINVPVDPR